jgi:hypothetical protein
MKISSAGGNLPSRVVYYGLPGTGKSSFAAQAPKPFFALMRGETGLCTLIDNGIVGPTDHNEDPVENLNQFDEIVDYLMSKQHDYRTLVIDALTGLEGVIFDRVVQTEFKGNKTKFDAYGAGPAAAVDTVEAVFRRLDELRLRRKMGVILIAHSKIGKFKNPEGIDFNRYLLDCEDKTASVINKWADMVLFVKRAMWANKDGLKVTGEQGDLFLHTKGDAAYDAKNRIDLPEKICLGDTAQSAWAAFAGAVKASRSRGQQPVAKTAEVQPTPEPETAAA